MRTNALPIVAFETPRRRKKHTNTLRVVEVILRPYTVQSPSSTMRLPGLRMRRYYGTYTYIPCLENIRGINAIITQRAVVYRTQRV